MDMVSNMSGKLLREPKNEYLISIKGINNQEETEY